MIPRKRKGKKSRPGFVEKLEIGKGTRVGLGSWTGKAWGSRTPRWAVNGICISMDFENILNDIPQAFDCVKNFCKEIRGIISPIILLRTGHFSPKTPIGSA